MHCLSNWDGSHRGLVAAIKPNLRNPDSFDHIETRITPAKDGRHAVIMKYRAENGFGGMNIESAVASIAEGSCELIDYTSL
jgi:hypothetical protein